MITITINGIKFGGWKTAKITRSMDSICRVIDLTVTDRWAVNKMMAQIKPNDTFQGFIGDIKVLDGYIDRFSPSFNINGESITLQARDKSADLIDCSAEHRTGEWIGLKIDRIARDICNKFGIKLTVDSHVDIGAGLPFFRIEQGMKAFEAIQKICSLRGVMPISDDAGGIILTQASTTKIQSQLVEGINIKEATATYDATERYSKYTVKAQADDTQNIFENGGFDISGTVTDENIKRYRPIVIVEGAPIDAGTCQTVAKWELAKARGKSRNYSITVKDLLQESGELWPINKLVHLKSERLAVDEDLLISNVVSNVDSTGQFTELTLVPREAYVVIPQLKLESDANASPFGGV